MTTRTVTMATIRPTASWRDSARSPKLWLFDASATFPLLLMLFHVKLWTFALAMSTMLFLTVLSYYGFSIPVFGRWIRATLAGRRKMATPWWQ